jgi:hypothetical protein
VHDPDAHEGLHPPCPDRGGRNLAPSLDRALPPARPTTARTWDRTFDAVGGSPQTRMARAIEPPPGHSSIDKRFTPAEVIMSTETIFLVILIVFLLGGGGFYWSRRS